MKNQDQTKDSSRKNMTAPKLPEENDPVTDGQNLDSDTDFEQAENELNSKILEITMRIKDHYPELSQYLEEMPVTVPTEKDPEITLSFLRSYYESLYSLLKKYQEDFPKIRE